MIYEDYMRNVLGNDYQQAQMSNWNSINNSYIYPQMQFENDSNIRKLYPDIYICLLYTSPSPRDPKTSRMPSSA